MGNDERLLLYALCALVYSWVKVQKKCVCVRAKSKGEGYERVKSCKRLQYTRERVDYSYILAWSRECWIQAVELWCFLEVVSMRLDRV